MFIFAPLKFKKCTVAVHGTKTKTLIYLLHGVMVAQKILDLLAWVRTPLQQQIEKATVRFHGNNKNEYYDFFS